MRSFIDIVSANPPEPQRLDELWWGARYAAAKAIEKNPGCFVHFSKIDKLGVNPSKQHRDPPGVYFYPGKWLFSDDASLSQFATEYEFYFLVRLRMGANFINLGTLTAANAKKIATRNGWIEDFNRLAADPKVLLALPNVGHNPKVIKKAGGLFYAVMDYLVNVEKKFRWLQMLRGVSGLYDPGLSIIASGEPAQAVVFDASAIEVIESGRNSDDISRTLAAAFQGVAQKVGGTFSYKRKIPTITIQKDGRFAEVGYDYGNWRWITSYSKEGFLAVDIDRSYSHSTGDAESYASDMAFKIDRAFKQADNQPVKSGPWNSVACMRLKTLIGKVGGRTYQSVKGGTYRIFAAERSFGGTFDRQLEITTNDAETVTVEISIDGSGRGDDDAGWEAKFERTLDARSTPEQVADEALRTLWAQVKPNLNGNVPVQKISDIIGFNFTRVVQDEGVNSTSA